MADRDGLPWVVVPERLDRRLRLGPFASGRDAVKFVTAAAVGAVVSLAVQPWAGLPIVVAGAVVALWRPDGEALDERVSAVVRWAARRATAEAPLTAIRPSPAGRGTVTRPDGRRAAVVRTGGVPLAFLPPTELARQFELYRELWRSVEGQLIVVAGSAPIHAGTIVPGDGPLPEGERAARDGYRELVSLLARRRSVRRVHLALSEEMHGAEGLRRLEAAVDLLSERLADLGVRCERLRDRALAGAAVRLGWLGREGGP